MDITESKKEKEPTALIWLPESLVKKIKKETSEEQQFLFINEYLKECKIDMSLSIEALDADIIIFKSKMLAAKKAFKEAKDEQLNANYELWEKYDKDLSKVSIKVDKLTDKLAPIANELANIDELFGKIRSYNIDKFLETLNKISNLYGREKEMFKFLIDNFSDKK